MKKVYVVLLLVLLSTINVSSQWRKVLSKSSESLTGVCTVDNKTIYTVGWYGSLYKSTDGGITFAKLNSTSAKNLKCVCFIDNNTGYIGGEQLTLLKTTDGGNNWSPLPTGQASASIIRIHFFNDQIGYILSTSNDSAKVQKTTDGGSTWSIMVNHKTGDLEDMSFINENTGVVVGGGVGKMDMYYTKDGQTFTKAPVPSLGGFSYSRIDLHAVSMVDANTVFATGWGSLVGMQPTIFVKSTDGGATWTYLTQAVENRIYDNVNTLVMKDATNGLAGGGGNRGTVLVQTTDGMNFKKLDVPFGSTIQGSCALHDTAFIVGDDGFIAKTPDFGNTGSFLSPTLGATYRAINWVNENKCIAVGDKSMMVKSTDKGVTWTPSYLHTNGISPNTNAMVFPSSNIGYAAQSSRMVSKTTDGGESWFAAMNDTVSVTANNYDIKFIDENYGFVLGQVESSVDYVYKTTDGGASWTTKSAIINQTPASIDFINKDVGAYVGRKMTAAYTTDGGENWNLASFPGITSINDLKSIKFLNENVALCCGVNFILKSNDGGKTWAQVPNSPTLETFVDIQYKNQDSIYILGTKSSAPKWNALYLSTDMGDTWTNVIDTNVVNYTESMTTIGLDYNGKLWLAGSFGSIFTTSPVSSVFDLPNQVKDFQLYNNYPNPFNPSTTIKYDIKNSGNVTLIIYDILGNKIDVLDSGYRTAGTYQFNYNASKLASGVYFYTLNINGTQISKKMMLIK